MKSIKQMLADKKTANLKRKVERTFPDIEYTLNRKPAFVTMPGVDFPDLTMDQAEEWITRTHPNWIVVQICDRDGLITYLFIGLNAAAVWRVVQETTQDNYENIENPQIYGAIKELLPTIKKDLETRYNVSLEEMVML